MGETQLYHTPNAVFEDSREGLPLSRQPEFTPHICAQLVSDE